MNFDEKTVKRFQPLHKRILVKRHEEAKIGSIIVPDAYRSPDRIAKVVKVGPDVKEVKVGDRILIPGMALLHPDFEQEMYALITEADVGLVYHG